MEFPVDSKKSYHPGDSCNRTLAVKRSKPYPPQVHKASYLQPPTTNMTKYNHELRCISYSKWVVFQPTMWWFYWRNIVSKSSSPHVPCSLNKAGWPANQTHRHSSLPTLFFSSGSGNKPFWQVEVPGRGLQQDVFHWFMVVILVALR